MEDYLVVLMTEQLKIWQIETGELLKSIEFEKAVNCVKILN